MYLLQSVAPDLRPFKRAGIACDAELTDDPTIYHTQLLQASDIPTSPHNIYKERKNKAFTSKHEAASNAGSMAAIVSPNSSKLPGWGMYLVRTEYLTPNTPDICGRISRSIHLNITGPVYLLYRLY